MAAFYFNVQYLVQDMPLTDTQRMTHLHRALVEDPAKRTIGGILNHGHLYRNALLELEEQFGNKQLLPVPTC